VSASLTVAESDSVSGILPMEARALELEEDLGAVRFLDLSELVPTPDKAMRIPETSIAKILKSRCIRRLTAAEALVVLRKSPVTSRPLPGRSRPQALIFARSPNV
jgi:hypothetical protein